MSKQSKGMEVVEKNVDASIRVNNEIGQIMTAISIRVRCTCGNELSVTSNEQWVECSECKRNWSMFG